MTTKAGRLAHPLLGADLATLTGALARSGPLPLRSLDRVLAFVGSACLRLPFTALERAYAALSDVGLHDLDAPVFVVGHWRSGTTHLHNLLGCSREFGLISPLMSGLPWELFTLARWFRPWMEKALPEDRGVDGVAVTPESPQEDEIPVASMQRLSVFHAVYFPRAFRETFERGVFFEGAHPREIELWERRMVHFLAKVARHRKKRCILVKNPAYTARIARLVAIWPDARFVHVYRDPHVVFASTVHYYQKLLAELALQPFDHVDLEAFVLDTYPEVMDRLHAESAALPPRQFTEVRFEDLERDPLPVLERVHAELRLPGWDDTRPRVEDYLASVAGYRKNVFQQSERERERVAARWRKYIERYGYASDYSARCSTSPSA